MATDSSLSVATSLTGMADACKLSFSAGACSLKRKRPPQIEIPNVLQEIKTGRLGIRNSATQNEAMCVGGDGYGVSCMKGKKKFMEDTHKAVSGSPGKSYKGFFGVYDGHGGRKAAEFVAENLHTNVLEMMENCEDDAAKEEAVKSGYLKTDQKFLDLGVGSGACCVTAVIEGQNIIVSNAGDCRAVLCRGGVAEGLTKDHRAEVEGERKRIEDKGGYIEMHRGTWRVHGVLSVSRSIGDAHLKDWVVSEPHTKILNLTPDMEFLVLASDGLWDEVGNQEAVDRVMRLCHPEKKLGPVGELCSDNGEDIGRVNVSPSSKIRRVSLIKQQKVAQRSPSYNYNKQTVDSSKESENDFPSENESPPSKCRRTSLLKRLNMNLNTNTNMETESPSQGNGCYKKTGDDWKDSENGFTCENLSPPSKCRRVSLLKRLNMNTNTKTGSPSQENSSCEKRSASLVAACKELVNLAASRGSLDDITVMIIDLDHFRSKAVPL